MFIYSDCDQCNASPHCGFCFIDKNGTFANGSCLVTAGAYSENSAAGMCSAEQQKTEGAIWAYDFCPSDYAWITFLGMVMYIVSFAPGESFLVGLLYTWLTCVITGL